METKLLQHRAVALAVFLSGSFSFAPFTPRDAAAADVAVLSAETWSAFAPEGKEVDAIYGDIVIRNQHLTTVVAAPNRLRNANMTVRDVGGGLVDLTVRSKSNDQLSAFYPGGGLFKFHDPKRLKLVVDGKPATLGNNVIRGEKIELSIESSAGPCEMRVAYMLSDKQTWLDVQSTFKNVSKEQLDLPMRDSLRADRTFRFGTDPETHLFWADDEWFGQAYGIQCLDRSLTRSGSRGVIVHYEETPTSLAANATYKLRRRLLVGGHLAAVRGQAAELLGRPVGKLDLQVKDAAGPVANALVSFSTVKTSNEKEPSATGFATGRTDNDGRLTSELPIGAWQLTVAAQGRPKVELAFDIQEKTLPLTATMAQCGYVEAAITDAKGAGVPCKVAFHGIEGTATPDFGPDSSAYGVKNLQYTADGTFRTEIAPGAYEVLISRGPEHDLETQTIQVKQAQTATVAAALRRVVDTPGWISSDFHSHSSPSGDNTSSQRGRVLNLLAEHIEFGPCTEHNRISTYTPHLDAMKATHFMATCPGMELTGGPLVINHQNTFPLIHRPRTQDGGGPRTDSNPVVQIERLAMWDDKSDKLVQINHPNLVQIVGDKDQNGEFDGGFAGMLGYADVIEVHPLDGIFSPPNKDPAGRKGRNPIFHWMQMLNIGYRIPGVINTDAHYNFHESGWRRNYLASPTDDVTAIKIADMVKSSEQGRVVMTNGPYLNVKANTDQGKAGPGQDVRADDGKVLMHIRVQCPNWLDVNRVQLFINGRPSADHNMTRRTHPKLFSDGVVKFDQQITLALKSDAHVIVAVAGEGLELGRAMGPTYGKRMPIAVANPVFVDVDGKGFQPNQDLLDLPLPHAKDAGHHHHGDHHHDEKGRHTHAESKR